MGILSHLRRSSRQPYNNTPYLEESVPAAFAGGDPNPQLLKVGGPPQWLAFCNTKTIQQASQLMSNALSPGYSEYVEALGSLFEGN
jgi:hypothetical protein